MISKILGCKESIWMNNFQKVVFKWFWVEEISQFSEGFIESYNEESDEGNFLETDFQYPEK